LGLRTSLLDFFWLLAMTTPHGAEGPAAMLHLSLTIHPSY
jgi:hypothetical protein